MYVKLGLAALVVVTVVSAAGIMNPPAAGAREPNLVAFGDSIAADPLTSDWLVGKFKVLPQPEHQSRQGCPTGSNTYVQQVANGLGLLNEDYSCSGMAVTKPTYRRFDDAVTKAIADGALTVDTKRVLISVGANDVYDEQFNITLGNAVPFLGQAAGSIEAIKQAAPNARVQIVGYPTIASGDAVCLLHVVPSQFLPAPQLMLPQVAAAEGLAQQMQRELAQRTGVEFVDMKAPTQGNGMCAPDERREFAGVIDTTGPQNNLPVHANAAGHRHIAEVVRAS